MIQPYADNVIFFDTEFTTLDPAKGQLMSIGMVKYKSGKELYLEIEYDENTVEPWVKRNVIPKLTGESVTREAARKKINRFIGTVKEKPYLIAYVNQFDAVYWYKLFGSPKSHPAFWIPIDFASVLFGMGYKPNGLGDKKFLTSLGIERGAYDEHNALSDAKMLRDVYKAFYASLEIEE